MPTATSLRQYVSAAEIATFSGIASSAVDEVIMNLAESHIDDLLGPQEKAIPGEMSGKATAGNVAYLIDTSGDSQLTQQEDGFFKYCVVEIVAGTGAGQQVGIASSQKSTGKITFAKDLATAPDATSVYRLYQLGKVPRWKDNADIQSDQNFYRFIPKAVKDATLVQYEYIKERGLDWFSTAAGMQSERIGNYSYSRNNGAIGGMYAPGLAIMLRGIINRKGRFI